MPRFMIIKLVQSTGANSLMSISQSHLTYERAKEYGKVSSNSETYLDVPLVINVFEFVLIKAWFLKYQK